MCLALSTFFHVFDIREMIPIEMIMLMQFFIKSHIANILLAVSSFFFVSLRPRSFWGCGVSGLSPKNTLPPSDAIFEPAILLGGVVSGLPIQNMPPPSAAIFEPAILLGGVVSGLPIQNMPPPSAAILNDL